MGGGPRSYDLKQGNILWRQEHFRVGAKGEGDDKEPRREEGGSRDSSLGFADWLQKRSAPLMRKREERGGMGSYTIITPRFFKKKFSACRVLTQSDKCSVMRGKGVRKTWFVFSHIRGRVGKWKKLLELFSDNVAGMKVKALLPVWRKFGALDEKERRRRSRCWRNPRQQYFFSLLLLLSLLPMRMGSKEDIAPLSSSQRRISLLGCNR